MSGVILETAPSLPYHEPGIITILILASFLLLLNIINAALDRVLYCGLLGQVLIGIAWGTPGAKWLTENVQEIVVQLGYLGLILLVYEGGLHTRFQSLKANLLLSSGVALTGIAVPIALSYSLQELINATPLQAFAAGAALCSTSLGTTFTVLSASGLSSSRLGVVLTSAAMMDDVVGLVMVQVISNLGADELSWITIVRPILVSVGFAVVSPVVCLFVVKPLTMWLKQYRKTYPDTRFKDISQKTTTAFTIHTLLLIGLVTAATYAGTSNLFAAYIAGATISWWDSEVPHDAIETRSSASREKDPAGSGSTSNPPRTVSEEQSTSNGIDRNNETGCAGTPTEVEADIVSTQAAQVADDSACNHKTCGSAIYEQFYLPAVSKILQPFFFASIGFSIPITRMFRGYIVWRGLVYSVLMAFGKAVCGLWLVRFPTSALPGQVNTIKWLSRAKFPWLSHLWRRSKKASPARQEGTPSSTPAEAGIPQTHSAQAHCSANPPKPISLHPPLILALAMCARGEIGFLISGVAESKGIFSNSNASLDEPSDMFLVVTWAIVLCTIFGPLGVGLTVHRVKKLQQQKNAQQDGAGRDVLGVWGME